MRIDAVTINMLSHGAVDNGGEIEGLRHIKSLPFLSVVQAVEGSYDIRLGAGCERSTGEGGIFIAPANVRQTITHRIDADSGRMRARWIFLDATVNGRYPLDLAYSFPVLAPEEFNGEITAAIDGIILAEDVCDRMSAAYQLIKLLLLIAAEKNTRQIDEIAPALEYMEKNYCEHITISQLAAMVYMSEPGLYSAFRAATGKTPIAYLNDYRLSKASVMLKTTELPVKRIAAECGFDDALYFSRRFSGRYAMSPREYRRNPGL